MVVASCKVYLLLLKTISSSSLCTHSASAYTRQRCDRWKMERDATRWLRTRRVPACKPRFFMVLMLQYISANCKLQVGHALTENICTKNGESSEKKTIGILTAWKPESTTVIKNHLNLPLKWVLVCRSLCFMYEPWTWTWNECPTTCARGWVAFACSHSVAFQDENECDEELIAKAVVTNAF